MPLKISKKKSVYHLKGEINNLNVNLFLDYFENKIKSKKKIVLNIDKTKEIDKIGLKAIKEIVKKGTNKNKEIYIVGKGCKEIYDDMFQSKAV